MKIAAPPRPGLLQEGNLRKQQQVFDMVWNDREDSLLPSLTNAYANLLYLAHSAEHVLAVREGRHPNGFQDFDPEKLRHALESGGAFLVASVSALTGGADGVKVAFAPVSGFHHAAYAHCAGFCTFNALAVVAAQLRKAGLLPDGVLIIDGDGHYGDGTEDIIEHLGAQSWLHQTSLGLRAVNADAEFASDQINAALNARKYSLVMYQSGADAHADDPYGAGYLTDLEWGQRDVQVFSTCKALGLSVVWNLAGGYNGTKTINLHSNTFAAALQVFYPHSSRLPHKRRLG